MDFRYAIFDLDGTLLDSMPVWDHLGERYLLRRDREPRPDLREQIAAMDMRESADYLISTYALPVTPETLMREMNDMTLEAYRDCVQPKPGVPAYLAALRARGIRMSVATATDRPLVETALRRLGLLDCFDGIFTCTEVGKSKRHPDIYFAAMGAMGGTMDETMVFEDALHAIETAKAAGFAVTAVPDASAAKDEAAIRALADVWLGNFNHALKNMKSV